MRAFVTKIYDFFKVNTGQADEEKNFREGKRSLRIPIYQREYKWENEKISALISDISKQRKFLGNIILDGSTGCHEIADGQQRITTCYLILVYLYNFYQGSPLEQQSLLNVLKPYGEFVLNNDLNESLDNYDIVRKIEMIQSWHSARGLSIPAHISVFFSFIHAMPEYQTLLQHKTDGASEETIKSDYQAFLRAYFSEEKESDLLFNLQEQFRVAFRN